MNALLSAVLWTLAVLTYGVGDLVTTVVGVRHDGIQEGSPLTRRLFGAEPSLVAFGLFKVGLLAAFYAAYAAMRSEPYALLIPGGVAAIGCVAVWHNVRAIRRVRRRIE